jgi:hypothetical protein
MAGAAKTHFPLLRSELAAQLCVKRLVAETCGPAAILGEENKSIHS